MIKAKKLVPEVYTQSFDMSLFLGLLDLVYDGRELDELRAKNSHLPKHCFKEDLRSLSSLLSDIRTTNRDLLSLYRSLVQIKGSEDALIAIGQLAADITPFDGQRNAHIVYGAMKTAAEQPPQSSKVVPTSDWGSDYSEECRLVLTRQKVTVDQNPTREYIEATLYVDFAAVDINLLSALLRKFAPFDLRFIIRPASEYTVPSDTAIVDLDTEERLTVSLL